jgi:copper chaperone CopZ
MAGPATNAATMTVIKQSMGTKALISYLSSIIGGALIMGVVVDLLPPEWFVLPGMDLSGHNHEEMGLSWFAIASAITLFVLILNGFRLQYIPTKIKTEDMADNEKVFTVEGMTCNHCKSSVEKNLAKLDKIEFVQVDLANNAVIIKGDNIDNNVIEEAVKDLGYDYKGEK